MKVRCCRELKGVEVWVFRNGDVVRRVVREEEDG